MMANQSDTINSLTGGHFITFVKDHNILATSVAALLSAGINEVTNNVVEHLVMPVINKHETMNGTDKETKKIEDIESTLWGHKIKIGKVILAFFKFVIITLLIFIIAKIIKNFMDQ
jgi:large-conductance mechanosensitive channel